MMYLIPIRWEGERAKMGHLHKKQMCSVAACMCSNMCSTRQFAVLLESD